MIENILPSTKSKVRIIKTIYENPGVNITELINKARTSPNTVINYVDNLVRFNVVAETRSGGKNKTHLRLLRPNLLSSIGKVIYTLVETDKKYNFLDKYKEFKPIINQFADLFKDNNIFCLIHGSFARFSPDKNSDIDILIVGKVDEKKRERISEILVTLKREYSVEIESEADFIKKINKPFHQTILKDHIIVWNEQQFISCLSKSDFHKLK